MTEIHQVRIFLAINDKGDIQPLSSQMMFAQGKSTIIVRANVVLLDEDNRLINSHNITSTVR